MSLWYAMTVSELAYYINHVSRDQREDKRNDYKPVLAPDTSHNPYFDTRKEALVKEIHRVEDMFAILRSETSSESDKELALEQWIPLREYVLTKSNEHEYMRRVMIAFLRANNGEEVKALCDTVYAWNLLEREQEYWLGPCLLALASWIRRDKKTSHKVVSLINKGSYEKSALFLGYLLLP